jgi:AcrR family transcriptional regulator
VTRPRSDEWRKQEIRAAAVRCFVRRGFAATRLLDIAREAGLSKGGVYFHYRAKEALFHDILDAQLSTLESRWSFEPVADQPADQTLSRLIVAHLRTMEDEPDETRLNHLLVSMAPQDAGFREKLEEAFRVMRSLYAGVISRGLSEGVFAGSDADSLAHCVLAVVQGLAMQSSTDPHGKLPIRPEQAAQNVLRMISAEPRAAAVSAANEATT